VRAELVPSSARSGYAVVVESGDPHVP
jgi:hypothetical protein